MPTNDVLEAEKMNDSVHENVSKGVKRDQQLFDLKIDPCMASSTLVRARKVALDEMFFFLQRRCLQRRRYLNSEI